MLYVNFSKTCDKVSQDILGLGFAILHSIDTLGRMTFCCGGWCLVHCRMLSSSHGFNALFASSTPPSAVITKNVFRRCQVSPGGQNRSQLRIDVLDADVPHILNLWSFYCLSVQSWWFIYILYPFAVHGITMLSSGPNEERSHLSIPLPYQHHTELVTTFSSLLP